MLWESQSLTILSLDVVYCSNVMKNINICATEKEKASY